MAWPRHTIFLPAILVFGALIMAASAEAGGSKEAKGGDLAGHSMNVVRAAAVLDSHIDPYQESDDDLEETDRQAVANISAYGAARHAALALSDPMAQEVALQKAQARLAASFGQPALSSDELARINALVDQAGH